MFDWDCWYEKESSELNVCWSSKKIRVDTLWCHDAWFHLWTGTVFKRPIPQHLQLIKVSDNSIETISTNSPLGMTKQFYGGVFKSINKFIIFIAPTRVIFHLNEVEFSITFRRHFYSFYQIISVIISVLKNGTYFHHASYSKIDWICVAMGT